jgi:hypothetical protein
MDGDGSEEINGINKRTNYKPHCDQYITMNCG